MERVRRSLSFVLCDPVDEIVRASASNPVWSMFACVMCTAILIPHHRRDLALREDLPQSVGRGGTPRIELAGYPW